MFDRSILDRLPREAERENVHRHAVGAVIPDGGRVLLLQRRADDFMGDIFEIPGGVVEPGEGIDAALTREVLEECGLMITALVRYLGHFDYPARSGEITRQFNFAVEVAAPEPVLLAEHQSYIWHPLAKEPPTTGPVTRVLRRYEDAMP